MKNDTNGTKTPPAQNMRPTIGYLTSSASRPIIELGWLGIIDAVHELDANLICFSGGRLRSIPEFQTQKNVIFDLVDSNRLDGLIVHATGLSPYIGQEAIEDFVRRYHPLPLVSSAGPLAKFPCVIVDQRQGVCKVVSHLIEAHGCQRLIFIRGPIDHLGADERYQGYVEALTEHGLPIENNLVLPPPVGWASPREDIISSLTTMLEERDLYPQTNFDAIVANDDHLALCVIELLQEQGVKVPDDVAVVGFNDISESWSANPALTTVRPLFYNKGYQAVEILLARLQGKVVPAEVHTPCEVVIRQSCGCPDREVAQASVGQIKLNEAVPEVIPRADIIVDITQTVDSPDEIIDDVSHLVDSFLADLQGDSPGVFLREMQTRLPQTRLTNRQVMEWHNLISALRRNVLPYLSNRKMIQLAEDLWQQTRVLIGKTALQSQAHHDLQTARYTEALRMVNAKLTTAFDLAEIRDVLTENLSQLGISSCYLSLYENPHTYEHPGDAPEWSRLVLAYDEMNLSESNQINLGGQGIRFPSCQLLPDQIWPQRQYSFVVEPLYFREYQIGFVLFEIGPHDGVVYEVLSSRISSSLRGAMLFDENRQSRAAAEKANQLKTRLLANVSHELRTPLNMIIGTVQQMLDLSMADSADLPQSLLADVLRIQSNAEHQLRLINDLLDLSRAEIDELDIYPEFVDVQPLLKEVFTDMANTYGGDVEWRLKIPDRLPVIHADPVRLRQILLNLLSNAGKFANQGQVVLGAEVTPPNLHIWVRDTGAGIPLDMQERIFEPFATANHENRQTAGVGLGLSITRRLVALHGGSIKLASEHEEGSTFHVYLPLPALGDQPRLSSESTNPVVLLISTQDDPVSEVVEFSERQGLEILRVPASDNLDEVMQRVQPAALAWDLLDATPIEWAVVQRLRNHPQLTKIPFILYGKEPKQTSAMNAGMTGLALKSMSGDTLLEAIDGLRPGQDMGPILLADNDLDFLDRNRRLVTEGLPGYDICTARNGAEAVECMEKNRLVW